jgi:hypothetical protein
MSLPVSIAMDASTRLTVRRAIARDYEILEIEWLAHPELSPDARGFPWADFGKEPGSAAADTWIFLSGIRCTVFEDATRVAEAIEGFLATSVAHCSDLPLSKLTGRVLYIEYVAVAPWNQPGPARRYRVGPLLLDYSAFEAEARCDAQVGLHALPHVKLEEWYRTQGLQDRGYDGAKFPADPARYCYLEGGADWVVPRSIAFKARVV